MKITYYIVEIDLKIFEQWPKNSFVGSGATVGIEFYLQLSHDKCF